MQNDSFQFNLIRYHNEKLIILQWNYWYHNEKLINKINDLIIQANTVI